jgi:hypothetical protein
MIGDSSACRDLAWRTANKFARVAAGPVEQSQQSSPRGTPRDMVEPVAIRRPPEEPDGHDGHKHGEPTLDDEHPLWFLELDRHAAPRSLVLQSSAERWRFT